MSQTETIVDQYTILGVDVLIKEHQFPDSSEIWYHAFFRLGSEYHVVRRHNSLWLREDVWQMVWKYYKNNS